MNQAAPVVCSLESRRASDMADLIERHGGTPLVAPSMREVPLEDNAPALDGIRRIVDGSVHVLVLLTGVGTDAMLDLARSHGLHEQLLSAMNRIPLIVRGPKPVAVLHRLGLNAAVRADSPNTWRELIVALDASSLDVNDITVAVQEYGASSPELTAALEERGARVLPVSVYRWALPDDCGPLESAIRATVDGMIDITLFTSAQQVRHVLQVADQLELRDNWLRTVPRVASIGPTCSEALREAGLDVWFEAEPPKMGSLGARSTGTVSFEALILDPAPGQPRRKRVPITARRVSEESDAALPRSRFASKSCF